MPLLPTLTEEFTTSLTPADIIRRLGYRTAPAKLVSLGGVLEFRSVKYQPMHYFLGTLAATSFTLQRLPQSGQGWFTDFGSALRTSVAGETSPLAGGTRLVLRYQVTPLSVPVVALGLLGLAYHAWNSQQALGLALLQTGLLAGVSWLGIYAFFRFETRQLNVQLVELLQLVPTVLG